MIHHTSRFLKLSGCFLAFLTSPAVLSRAREPVDTGAKLANNPLNGKNTGTEPTRILMTIISSKGVPITQPAAAPERSGKNEVAGHEGHDH